LNGPSIIQCEKILPHYTRELLSFSSIYCSVNGNYNQSLTLLRQCQSVFNYLTAGNAFICKDSTYGFYLDASDTVLNISFRGGTSIGDQACTSTDGKKKATLVYNAIADYYTGVTNSKLDLLTAAIILICDTIAVTLV